MNDLTYVGYSISWTGWAVWEIQKQGKADKIKRYLRYKIQGLVYKRYVPYQTRVDRDPDWKYMKRSYDVL